MRRNVWPHDPQRQGVPSANRLQEPSFNVRYLAYPLGDVGAIPTGSIIMIAMKTTIPWYKLQHVAKLIKVRQLATMRISLLEKSRIRRAAKSSKNRRKKEKAFRSAELRAFFDTMPDDMKKFVGG